MDSDVILRIQDLHTFFYTELGISKAVNGVNLNVLAGKVTGIVGESGCGKSATALSILQLVPPPGKIVKGKIILHRKRKQSNHSEIEEVILTDLGPRSPEIRSIRGAEIAIIFQEPMVSLNPSYTIGNQIMEAIQLHQMVSKQEAEHLVINALEQVEMPNPLAIVKQYPHELSGGMRQRAMIAMALSCWPSLLIADEPTTALDVTTEAQILDVFKGLQKNSKMTIIFITHNLGVVARICDTVAVMYFGRIMEQAPVDALFYEAQHPYTKALLHSIPHMGRKSKDRLETIKGVVPDPYFTIKGCPFYPRCDYFMDGVCDTRVPALVTVAPMHAVRCFLYSKNEEDDLDD